MVLFNRFVLLLTLCAAPLAHAEFTVNADGTVTDTTTGLVWDRCVLGTRTSVATTCAANTNSTYTWANALVQVTTRNIANHLGYSDWRLPNINELESLVDLSVASGATINATAFPNTPITGGSWGWGGLWSSTTYAPDPVRAWSVGFDYGYTDTGGGKTSNVFVRLVRSGQSLASFDSVGTTSYTASAPSGSSGPGNVTTAVAGGGATCALGSVAYQSANSVGAAPPAGVTFAHGVVNFTTTPSCTAGGTITVTLTYPSPLAAGTQFYKYGPATAGAPSSWYMHPATIAGNTITYTVTDGGVGDSNPTAGQITDPGGPGLPGGAGGVAGVPTLGEWAMALLGALMALGTYFTLRRRAF
ncbi:MAG: IPTL-CTERM sorting domain-containing protein [Burkholderiaceae bacterium]